MKVILYDISYKINHISYKLYHYRDNFILSKGHTLRLIAYRASARKIWERLGDHAFLICIPKIGVVKFLIGPMISPNFFANLLPTIFLSSELSFMKPLHIENFYAIIGHNLWR